VLADSARLRVLRRAKGIVLVPRRATAANGPSLGVGCPLTVGLIGVDPAVLQRRDAAGADRLLYGGEAYAAMPGVAAQA